MSNIVIKENKIELIFNQLQQELGGVLNILNKEYSLEINTNAIQGEITGSSINKNISFIDFDIRLNDDTVLVHDADVLNPIYFIYVAQGQLSYSFENEKENYDLEQFQTGIFSSEPSQNAKLFFKKNNRICASMITVNTKSAGQEEAPDIILKDQLLNTFVQKGDSTTFSYIGSYNLRIAEQIKQLNAIKQKGVVKRLLTKGIVFTILGLEIQQHNKDLDNLKKTGSLTVSELTTVKDFSEFIKNYPERPYSLDVISRKTALSPAKLQQGFKTLHNRTVSDYIRNVRVEKAEKLIRTTDLNISEIVYSIGLTSRSYFSKIFKKKYNCSPKNYQDHQYPSAVNA